MQYEPVLFVVVVNEDLFTRYATVTLSEVRHMQVRLHVSTHTCHRLRMLSGKAMCFMRNLLHSSSCYSAFLMAFVVMYELNKILRNFQAL
jgi:hypothetical protein